MARLEIIMGSMFSGKSSEMIRRLKRHIVIGSSILVVNSIKDIRNPNSVLQTHDNVTLDCIKTNNLLEIPTMTHYQNAKVIAIDEIQFFEGVRFFVEQALKDDKYIILAGLDGDFRQQQFGELFNVIPLADEITKLHALCMECMDGTIGPFTKRIVGGLQQELVGGCAMYKAVCRKHLV